jgi:CBS domain-containing protein
MPKTATLAGNRLMDRPEYASKQKPLTATAETTVFVAVLDMSKKNFGSVVVIDG